MSYTDTRRLMELEATVAELVARVALLEGGGCPICSARRAGDTARQQRRRQRHAIEADKMPSPIGRSPAVTTTKLAVRAAPERP